jgi:hypothetical protein
MKKFSTFIGMDVHKETIAVATAGKHGTPLYYGEIANTSEAITKLVKKVVPSRSKAIFCYEAGPWVRSISANNGHGVSVRCRSLFIDTEESGRLSEDRSTRCSISGAFASGE